jgi:hypothetical protein
MKPQSSQTEAARRRGRRGSVMIEFAFIALAFYLLFAGTLELGRMIATDQIIQNAARVGARELALVPLRPTETFLQALAEPQVVATIYDPTKLAVDVTGGLPNTGTWPVINRMLYPVMVIDQVGGASILHYPGAVLSDGAGAFTVGVPHVVSRDAQGHETIRWVPVIEEVRSNPLDPNTGPFSLAWNGAGSDPRPQRGLVALRINCPYQASTMTAFRQEADPGSGEIVNIPVLADDLAVIVQNPNEAPGQAVSGGSASGVFAGQYGLGKFYAMGTAGAGGVRPFRRLISAQAMFRREVYSQ